MNDALISLRYHDARKRIFNKLRRFQAPALLAELLARLHLVERGDFEAYRAQLPWRLQLLLKWTIAQGDFNRSRLELPTSQDINHLLNELTHLETILALPSDHADVQMFFRKLAYQQFWHQEPPQRVHLARQARLFRRLPDSHRLSTRFRTLTGHTISEFLTVSFALVATFLARGSRVVSREFFSPLESRFHPVVIDAVLATLSREPSELREFARRQVPPDPFAHHEFYERTPLTRFPLLRLRNCYWLYSLPILLRGVETTIYDILRSNDASVFMNDFGAIFEDYVRLGIASLGSPFLDETELRKKYGTGKVVDFAFTNSDGTVLIDAKGVEAHAQAMVTSSSEFLTRQVANSVLKGLAQAADVSNRMGLVDPPFVLIVTYKHLFLGSGQDFVRYADPAQLTACGDIGKLDLRRVFFVSIEEFDYLMSSLAARRMALAPFLANVTTKETSHEGKRMLLMQHINDNLQPYSTPVYLDEEFTTLMATIEDALQS